MLTENKILKASLRLFSMHGYSEVTTKKIAREAGLNEVTIFRKFGSKSNLFQQVITNYLKEGNVIKYLKKELTGTFEKDIMIYAKNFYLFLLNNESFYKIKIKQADEKTLKFNNPLKYKIFFVEYLEEKKENNEFIGNPEITAISLVSFIMGIFTFQMFNKVMLENVKAEDLIEIEVKKIILENDRRKNQYL